MSILKKIKFQLFILNNPYTIQWKMLYPWRNLNLKLKNYLIQTFGYLFSRNIQFFGEFGYELIGVIPYAYWLHKRNKLNATKSSIDSKCLYYFSNNHLEINIKRKTVTLSDFPWGDIHIAQINTSQWRPPPYKSEYINKKFVWEKPICVICNKYTSEWEGPPINFLSIEVLSTLFKLLKERYQIIYNRPTSKNIISDDQKEFFFNDLEYIKKKFPKIITIQELVDNNNDLTFNQLQMMIYANCDNFISVQGGSSVLTSYFGGKNIIFAKKGGELKHNSYNWYNQFSGSQIFHVDNYFSLIEVAKKEFL